MKNHKSFVLWFTGLSGSGKSTIANALEIELNKNQIHTYVLDGDNVRQGINKDLGFSEEDRSENLRRIAEVAKLMVDAGVVTIASFIAPLHRDRDMIKEIVGRNDFFEIYISTPIEICEQRDVKGLYKKARKGEIKEFTGISSPYEAPNQPAIEINTVSCSIEEAVNRIIKIIEPKLKG